MNVPGAHGAGAVDPVEHDEPDGQSVHSAASVSPDAFENVPAKHGSSADAPEGQKLPPLHTLHAVAPIES